MKRQRGNSEQGREEKRVRVRERERAKTKSIKSSSEVEMMWLQSEDKIYINWKIWSD